MTQSDNSYSEWLYALAHQLREEAHRARERGFADLAESLQHAGEVALLTAVQRDDVMTEETCE
jgi:hypothetical protein